MFILSANETCVNAYGRAPTDAGLLDVALEIAGEPTWALRRQRRLLADLPPVLRPYADHRLRLVADELQRREREAMVAL